MVSRIYKWCFWLLLVSCATDPDAKPLGKDVTLRLATTGESTFEENIHSLVIYAFRQSVNGDYLYYRTLARLGEGGIKALENTSNGKKFTTQLLQGDYEIYFMANASGNYTGVPQERVTRPGNIELTLPPGGIDSVYFIGNGRVTVSDGLVNPVAVSLNRAVSRLDLTLNGVAESIDSVRVTAGNITTKIGIDGSLSPVMTSVSGAVALNNDDVYKKDTVQVGFLTFPTAIGKSDLNVSFRAKSGDRKSEVITSVLFQPDRYVRLTGNIDDAPGAFLSFDVNYLVFILDDGKDFPLPGFVLQPR